jgi:DNA topoisomerase I
VQAISLLLLPKSLSSLILDHRVDKLGSGEVDMVTGVSTTKEEKTTKKQVVKSVAKGPASKTTKKTKATKATKKKAKTKKRGKRDLGEYSLVVVESPSKAKTIKKYLGRGYQVVASNGHVKDLPKSKLGVDLKGGSFTIDLVPLTGKKDKIERIRELARGAQSIYLAPDPDREGEAIAYHLAEEIGNKKKIYRVLFNAITKTSVTQAIADPVALDKNKYDSQKTRRVLDRLVGYKISPILWDKVQRGLSAGRVQSVALRIISEREEEIIAFKPEQWFSVHAHMEKDTHPFEAKYYGKELGKRLELTDEKEVKQLVDQVQGRPFLVDALKKKERRQRPTPPFTTSKLQQEGANKLGFTAKRTMMVAQKLYEGVQLTEYGLQGLVTYMRTDSVRTEPESLEALREYIKKNYGDDYLAPEPIIYKKRGKAKVQDAHEAIRPTNLELHPDNVKGDLTVDELKLYTLIWNKFISSQMAPAVIDQTEIIFKVGDHFFKSNGSIIKFPGFRQVYLESATAKKRSKDSGKSGDEEEQESLNSLKEGVLPKIEEGEELIPAKEPFSEEHWTSPPPRYNEASLVKDLEEQGLGRPSTYASIISNIQDRGYVEKIENRFLPTELGMVVCKMLVESFPDIMSVSFTANIEELLDQIEEGSVKWKKVLKDFWGGFEKSIDIAKEEMKNLKKQEIPTGVKCRKCDTGEYFIKWGRNGQFLACSNYPDCISTEDFRKHLDGTFEIIEKSYHFDPCPECGKRLVVKKGRYGRFLACEEYPNCKTSLPYVIDVHCPECKTGRFTEKQSRYGKVFYGCSSYPDCNNAMWTHPRKFDCASCGHSVMGERETKRDGHHLQCPKCKHKVAIEETPYQREE